MQTTRHDPGERDRLNWLLVVLALVLAGIHLYHGLAAPFVTADDARRFVVIAAAFLAGVVVYFAAWWRPLLYLAGTLLSVYLGQLWLLGGREYFAVGVLAGVVSTAFLLLSYLPLLPRGRPVRRAVDAVSGRPRAD